MNTLTTTAALTILTATTTAFSAKTQQRPSTAPNAYSSYHQRQDSAVLEPNSDIDAESSAAACRLNREAMRDTATSTAFAATAAQDGMVEVALAGLALRKSDDSQLRQLAQEVIQDYAQSNGELDSIVRCEGLILATELDAEHNALISRLNSKSGRAFDKAYLKHIARRHSEALVLLESAMMSGNPDVAAFARKSLSMLQEHQLLADSLRTTMDTRVAKTR